MPKTSNSQNLPYPLSPKINKRKLLAVGTKYQWQIILVLFAILLFWLIYFGLLSLNVWLIYYLWEMPLVYKSTYGVMIKIGLIAMAVTLFIFLIKFLFKSQAMGTEDMVEITEKEQPQLFAFLRKLSKEVGAPFPKKVYVNHEINAKVFYQNPILSLFFPVKKNLLIGLGLVNSLNLSEFKAVLAHEFGHFSQGSMRLGSYVYVSNRIIADMVFSRDRWDQFLDEWRSSDLRLAIFAWALTPFVYLVRQLMILMYRGLNALQSALSRQMEFHADRVAVSATGSDAILFALYKLGPASQAFQLAFQQLQTATEADLYSNNLFYHQQEMKAYLLEKEKEYKAQSFASIEHPEDRAKAYLFKASDEMGQGMYASHPSNYARELNAKKEYVEGPEDDRPAWILFQNETALAQKVTQKIWETNFGLPADYQYQDAAEVQEYINEELESTHFPEKYHDYYGQRYLFQVEEYNETDLSQKLQIHSKDDLKKAFQSLYDKHFIKALKEIQEEEKKEALLLQLLPIAERKKTVNYEGQTYHLKTIKQELEQIQAAEEENNEWFNQRDYQIFGLHYLALSEMQLPKEPYVQYYEFQWKIQAIHFQLQICQQEYVRLIQEIIEIGRMHEDQARNYIRALQNCRQKAADALEQANVVKTPPLSGFEEGKKLGYLLAPEGLPNFPSLSFDQEALHGFEVNIQRALAKAVRLFRKNLVKILQIQEDIEQKLMED
jgi:Zn-dependent protease with chaperone function